MNMFFHPVIRDMRIFDEGHLQFFFLVRQSTTRPTLWGVVPRLVLVDWDLEPGGFVDKPPNLSSIRALFQIMGYDQFSFEVLYLSGLHEIVERLFCFSVFSCRIFRTLR